MSINYRQDAIPNAFLRDLEDIEDRVYEEEYAGLHFANGEIIPLNIQNRPGIRTTTYRTSTAVGRFRLIRGYSTALPSIETLFREFTNPVHAWGGKYDISYQDVEAAKESDFPIEQSYISSVRQAGQQEMNRLMAIGDDSINMPGLLNHPEVLRSYVPSPWNATTAASVIQASMHDGCTEMVNVTAQVEQPEIMYLPPVQYNYVATTYSNPSAANEKILTDFIGSSPYIKEVKPLQECKGAGPNGEDVAIIMRRDPTKIKAEIYEDFNFKNMIPQGLGYERPAVFCYGGLKLYRPWSVHLLIGI